MPKRVERYLSYMPLPNSQHVYVNGAKQRLNIDYTIENGSYVIIPSAAEVGDRVEVRYAHLDKPGTPPPEYISSPGLAKPRCLTGTGSTDPFPWQRVDDQLLAEVSSPHLGNLMADGDTIEITTTVHNNTHLTGGSSTGVSWDGWFYFRKTDGCVSSFNYITGSIWSSGFGPYVSTHGPIPIPLNSNGHSVPSGSTLVAFSIQIYTTGNPGYRRYYERA